MPPLCPHLPIQTNPNPNNKSVQQAETLNFPTYYIAPIECNEIYLCLGRIVDLTSSPIIIEQPKEENNTTGIEQSKLEGPSATPEPTTVLDIRVSVVEKNTSFLPYLERLSLVNADPQPEFDFLGELKNLFVKIPLL